MKSLGLSPAHCFLLPVFFILHIVNANFGLIPWATALKYTGYYLILSIILLIAGYFLFRSIKKSASWTTTLLIIFFFFGATYDFLKENNVPHFLYSYKFLLPLIAVLIILLTIAIKRSRSGFTRLTNFFNVLFAAFFVYEAVIWLINLSMANGPGTLTKFVNNPSEIQVSRYEKDSLPDLFFVVFDEHTSSSFLRSYFHYDNSAFDSALKQHGFHVIENGMSNYNNTALSLASTFNFSYFDYPLEGNTALIDRTLHAVKQIRNSRIAPLLQQQGYKIVNCGFFDLGDNHPPVEPFFANEPSRMCYLETLWGRISRDVLWNVSARLDPAHKYRGAEKRISQDFLNLAAITNELATESDTPRFVYGHIMMPHSPYAFDRNGNKLANPSYEEHTAYADSLYLNQLIYTDRLILKMLGSAKLNTKRPRVIIIEGDHGHRDERAGAPREKKFANLNAWYFSDQQYASLYDSLSPVNTFRIVLNKYFQAGLPLLKDSTILLRGD